MFDAHSAAVARPYKNPEAGTGSALLGLLNKQVSQPLGEPGSSEWQCGASGLFSFSGTGRGLPGSLPSQRH